MSPKSSFNWLRALWRDILDSKKLMHSLGGQVVGQLKGQYEIPVSCIFVGIRNPGLSLNHKVLGLICASVLV